MANPRKLGRVIIDILDDAGSVHEDLVKYDNQGGPDIKRTTGQPIQGTWGQVPPSDPNQPRLTDQDNTFGGTISSVEFPAQGEVILYTNSPGCYWYWNSRQWIWR